MIQMDHANLDTAKSGMTLLPKIKLNCFCLFSEERACEMNFTDAIENGASGADLELIQEFIKETIETKCEEQMFPLMMNYYKRQGRGCLFLVLFESKEKLLAGTHLKVGLNMSPFDEMAITDSAARSKFIERVLNFDHTKEALLLVGFVKEKDGEPSLAAKLMKWGYFMEGGKKKFGQLPLPHITVGHAMP